MKSFTHSQTQDYCHVRKVGALPKGLKSIEALEGYFTVARNEAGYTQVIEATPNVTLYASLHKYMTYLKVCGDNPVVLEHREPERSWRTESVEIKPGIYTLTRLKESCACKEKPTDEEFAQMPKIFKACEPYALSTHPIDKAAAKKSVFKMYAQLGLKEPFIVWTQSPFANLIARSLINGISNKEISGWDLGDRVLDGIDTKFGWQVLTENLEKQFLHQFSTVVTDELRSEAMKYCGRYDRLDTDMDAATCFKMFDEDKRSMMNTTMENVRDIVWDLVPELSKIVGGQNSWSHAVNQSQSEFWDQQWKDQYYNAWESINGVPWYSIYGQNWSHRLAYFTFLDAIDGCVGFETLSGLAELCKTAGSVMPCENICFVSERHSALKLNERGQLHCADGPAFSYADGYAVYRWNGVAYPYAWATTKPTPAEALKWPNLEQRRIACEMIGWSTILRELKTVLIDKDNDPEIGTLISVTIPDIGREKFLRVKCGTGRGFVIPVPPEMQTARQANAWTWGLEPEEYKPEVRT